MRYAAAVIIPPASSGRVLACARACAARASGLTTAVAVVLAVMQPCGAAPRPEGAPSRPTAAPAAPAVLATPGAVLPAPTLPAPTFPAAVLEGELLPLVAKALESNPTLAAAVAELRAARCEEAAAHALPNPSISFIPGVTSPNGTGEELLVTQSLGFNGAPAARARQARARQRLTQGRLLAQLHDLVLAVRTAAYELRRARSQVCLLREDKAMAERFAEMARKQVDAGLRPEVDAAQARLEALRARQLLIEVEGEERVAVASMVALLGRGADLSALLPEQVSELGAAAGSPLAGSASTTLPAGADGERLLLEQVERALTRRPEQLMAAAECQLAQAEVDLARSEQRMDVVPQFRATSVGQGVRDYGVGVAVSLPLIDFGSVRQRVRAAEERAQAAQARGRAAELDARRELAQARARLDAALAAAAVATEACAQSQRLLDACRTGFGAGVTSVLTLLEAQRGWRAARADGAEAQAHLATARAQLDRAQGLLPLPWAGLSGASTPAILDTLRRRRNP